MEKQTPEGLDAPLLRLQNENNALRNKIRGLEILIEEVTPELDGITLETRIKHLKTKNLDLLKDKIRLRVLIHHLRKLMVSSVSLEENKKNTEQVKSLLEQELYRK